MTPERKTFGRKLPAGAAPPRPSAAATQANRGGDGGAVGPSIWEYKLVRQIGGFAAGVGILLGVQFFNGLVMKQAGHDLARQFENAGPRAATQALPADLQASSAMSCMKEAQKSPGPSFWEKHGASESAAMSEAELAKSAAYLRCLAVNDLGATCEPAARQRMVAGIALYLDLMRETREERQMTESGLGYVMTREPNVTMSRRPSDGFDPQLAASLAAMAARGRISTSDFGFLGIFAPAAVRDAIGNVTVTKKDCA